MSKITKALLALLLLCVAGVANAEGDEEFALTADMFKTWNGYGADASSTGSANVDFQLGTELGQGAVVAGTSTVDYLTYADLTGCTKMVFEGTADLVLRVLMNRQESNSGPLVEKNPVIGADGKVELDLTELAYVHLNAIKINWGGNGTVTSIKLVRPSDPLAIPKENLKSAIALAKMYNALAYTEASFGDLTQAIADAQDALNDAAATAESLGAAKTTIEQCIAALTLKEGFVELTADMFKKYASVTEPGEPQTAYPAYELFKASDLPFGDSSVGELNWADLTGYDKFIVTTVGEVKPRLCLNRLVNGGQQAQTQEDSKMLDINPNNGFTWSTEKYLTVDNGVYTLDVAQIVADYTFARLHCIKKQGWGAGVTVTGMYLYKEPAAEEEDVLPIDIQFGADYNDKGVQNYTSTWTATKDGKTWTIVNFNNNNNGWDLIKCGSKNADSEASITSPAINAVVKSYVVTLNKASNVNSAILTIKNGEETVGSEDITERFVKGDVIVPVEGQKGYSYVLTINNKKASGNGSVEVTKITLSAEELEPNVPVHIANTAETAYTVAKAIELIEAGDALDETVFVKGIVSQVDQFNETYKSINYWISDDGTTTNQFECYSGKGIDGADFASIDDVKVGAEVIVKGTMKKYGSTYEFTQNNQLVSYQAPAVPAEPEYYLVGTMTNWQNGDYQNNKLVLNTEATEVVEYMITMNLSANDEFKVIKPEGETLTWFPAEGGNYTISEAGEYDIYFRPNYDGNDDWHYKVLKAIKKEVVAGPTFDFQNNNGNWAIGAGSDYAKGELTEDNPITMDGVTLTCIKGEATNAVRYFTNTSKGNCLWIFKNNSIKLTAPEGKCITKVEFTMQTGSFDLTPSKGEVAENVWTGQATEVTFGPNAKGTRYVYAISVTVEDGVPVEPILTLTAPVGAEVTLKFGVYDTEDEFTVDFGGENNVQTAKVGIENKGPVNPETGDTPTATEFTGTVAGDGIIKVYGKNDIWYYNTSGNVLPTAFDQAKLMNVVQMVISGANAESVVLPAYEKMTQFDFTNSPVKSVDITKVPTLTSLSIFNTTLSAFEPQLTSIDLSQNVNLEKLIVGGNTYKKGEITALDLTNNTKLEQISAENNKIASVTGIPVSVKNIYLSNNELESLTLPELTNKGWIKIDNNKFTLATLPTKPAITTTSKYTYAPQPAYEVAENVSELDLSSQLTATGILTEPVTTTFSFFAGETALVEGTDYDVLAPGKFLFTKAQAEKVHAVMATTAFPKFTGANAYKTTEFTVVPVNYYVVGTMNGWAVDESYKMALNAAADVTEYSFTMPLTTTSEFKVVKVEGENWTWYPEPGENYGKNGEIAADGTYTIYFRPNYDGGDDWYCNVIYVAKVDADGMAAAIATAEGLIDNDAVAVGKLIAALDEAKAIENPTEAQVAALQAAIDQFKADNAPQEADVTAQFPVDYQGWSGATGLVGWAAPTVTTNDGRSTAACERYEGTCANTGDVFTRTLTGLTNGTYRIEVYGAAAYTSGRGFESELVEGDETAVYLYAETVNGTVKQYIPAHVADNFNGTGIATAVLEGVVISDGTVKLGMYKEKPYTNWHVVQIKGVTALALAKDLYATCQAELTELVEEGQALAADEYKTVGKEEFSEVLAVAEEATTDKKNWYNVPEAQQIVADLKTAIANFKKANWYIDFAAGEYYIIDAESGLKMAAGNDYGTRGIVNEMGLDLTLTPYTESRTVTIDSRVSNGGDNHFLSSNLYMDSSEWGWALEYRGFGFYILEPVSGKYINVSLTGNNLELSETPREWIIVSKEGVIAQHMEEMAEATENNPVDATFLLQNPNFNRNDQRVAAWTVSDDCTNKNLNGGNQVNNCAESYHSVFTISQAISGAPAGIYKLTAQGFYRQDDEVTEDAPVFFIGSATGELPVKTGEENNMNQASESFTSGLYTIEPIEVKYYGNGDLTIGVRGTAEHQWVIFDNFQLSYCGPFEVESYTVAGVSEGNEEADSVFGKKWDPTLEANDMVKGDNGVYTLTKEKVSLTPGTTIYYKVVADRNWDASWGFDGNNADYVVNLPDGESLPEGKTQGVFNITFMFNPVEVFADNNFNVNCTVVYDKDATTGIKDVNRETITNNGYYNLNGQKVEKAQKGLYIINGKKVVVK